jgi:hydroxylaminobenzene mutase
LRGPRTERTASGADRGRRLLWHGALLLLLGLLAGVAGPYLTNPRMGLAAHLGGVTNALLLLVLGLAWREVALSPRLATLAFAALLAGGYGNFATTLVAALLGTSTLTPIAGSGFRSEPWQEALVGAGLIGVGVAMLVAVVLLLVGFGGRR